MLVEAILLLMVGILSLFLDMLAVALGGFEIVIVDLSNYVGLVFGNIWLLNGLLPISHLFAVFTLAIGWRLALFTFDGALYVVALFNLAKRTFFRIG